MTLYNLADQYLELLDLMDDPEVDEQTILDTMELISDEFEDKADGYAKVISELNARLAGIGNELRRLTERKRNIENNIDRLKASLQGAMVLTGKTKFKTDLFSFCVAKNGGALPVVLDCEPEDLPDEFCVITKTANKKALAEALNNGEIPWAHYGERGESLRIR